jgi:hypothetical protein
VSAEDAWRAILAHLKSLGSGPDHEDDLQEVLMRLVSRWGTSPALDPEAARRDATKSLYRWRWYRLRLVKCRQESWLGEGEAEVPAES